MDAPHNYSPLTSPLPPHLGALPAAQLPPLPLSSPGGAPRCPAAPPAPLLTWGHSLLPSCRLLISHTPRMTGSIGPRRSPPSSR